jgi:hypothetical protein
LRAVLNPRLILVLVLVGGAVARGVRVRKQRAIRRRRREEWKARRAEKAEGLRGENSGETDEREA